tara:strand:+ start:670 stop:1419 length:750 start_codon:yes stop_codon:yes gene_type:complete
MRKLLVLTLIFSACGGAEVAEEPTTTTTAVKETTTTSSSTTTTVKETTTTIMASPPVVSFTNCPYEEGQGISEISEEEFGLIFEIEAGSGDIIEITILLEKDGVNESNVYFTKEYNSDIITFPEAYTTGSFSYLLDNVGNTSVTEYIIEVSIISEQENGDLVLAYDLCFVNYAPLTETQTTTTTTAPVTTTTVGESKPDNPGDTKNCGDFDNYSDAKAWFDTYYPYYGDVAKLDRDENLIPCESLPGAP